jgi:hypothetical protein
VADAVGGQQSSWARGEGRCVLNLTGYVPLFSHRAFMLWACMCRQCIRSSKDS